MIYFIISYPSLKFILRVSWKGEYKRRVWGKSLSFLSYYIKMSILTPLRWFDMLFRQVLDKKCVRHLVYDDWQDKDSSCQENLGPFRRRPFHGRSVMVTQVQIYKSLTCSSTTCLDGQFDFLPPGLCIKQYSFWYTPLKFILELKQGNDISVEYSTGPHSAHPQIQTFNNSIPVGSIQSHIVEIHFS